LQNETGHSRRSGLFWGGLILALWVAGCGPQSNEKARSKGEVVAARIETLEALPLTIYTYLPGTVISADRIEVSSRLTGYVHDLKVHEGQEVKKGQQLLSIDPTGVRAEIRQAEAEVEKAKAGLDNAEANYKRYKDLFQNEAATQENFEAAERNWKVAVGDHQAAVAALESARSQLKYSEVRSPFNGLVVSKLVDNGQLAAPGTPLLVLEDPAHLQVECQVPDHAFARLGIGQVIQIEFQGADYKSRIETGSVERLVEAADPVTHTHLVKIDLPAVSAFYSGEYGLVRIPVGEKEGVVVPDAAIHTRAGITGVFVMAAGDRAQFRMVTTGKRLPEGTVILSGLMAGERIIIEAKGPLANGVKISAEPEARHE
jgi:multidrug efflux system membrane fusion protein